MRDLDYVSVSPAGQLFTQKLFPPLEHIKASDRISNGIQEIPWIKCTDKLQRRLLFEVVNEILVEKFVWDHSKKWLGKRNNYQHQLVHGSCSEIVQLQANRFSCSSDEENDGLKNIIEKDPNNQSAVWAERVSDSSGVVLDIESLIFKDLVNEVVTRAAGHMIRA